MPGEARQLGPLTEPVALAHHQLRPKNLGRAAFLIRGLGWSVGVGRKKGRMMAPHPINVPHTHTHNIQPTTPDERQREDRIRPGLEPQLRFRPQLPPAGRRCCRVCVGGVGDGWVVDDRGLLDGKGRDDDRRSTTAHTQCGERARMRAMHVPAMPAGLLFNFAACCSVMLPCGLLAAPRLSLSVAGGAATMHTKRSTEATGAATRRLILCGVYLCIGIGPLAPVGVGCHIWTVPSSRGCIPH